MEAHTIVTQRLVLIPVTYSVVDSLLKGDNEEIEKLGLQLSKEWPREDTQDILKILIGEMKEKTPPTGYGLWMIVRKDNQSIIGDGGFKGEPDEEEAVEIGYGIVANERRQGYGYEAVKGLVNWALSQNEVTWVKAECLISNSPSIRILQKLGMDEIKRDSETIYWQMKA